MNTNKTSAPRPSCLVLCAITTGCILATPLPAGDFTAASIGKGLYYEQISGETPVLRPVDPYVFNAEVWVPTNTVAWNQLSSSLILPGKTWGVPMPSCWDGQWRHYQWGRYADQSLLDTQYPDGTYTIDVFRIDNNTHLFITNAITAAGFPNAPAVENLAAAQAVDPAQDFELRWNAFEGGTAQDFIFCQLRAASSHVFSSPSFAKPNALDGTARSFVIPTGTLLPGRAYLACVVFASTQTRVTDPEAETTGATFHFSRTDFWLKTQGPDDNTPPAIAWTSPTIGATGVPVNTPVTVHFTRPMARDSYSLTRGGSSGGAYSIQFSPDGLEVVLTPGTTMPAEGSVTYLFNRYTGGQLGFGDLNGNPLAPDTLAVSFNRVADRMVPAAALLSAPRPQGDGSFQIQLQGDMGFSYSLQQSTTLNTWSTVATNIAFGGTATFAVPNTNPPGVPMLYRAVAR